MRKGFSLIELLVIITIIGVLSSFTLVSLSQARIKARDSRRKAEISQIGRFLALNCYLPDLGGGEYDFLDIVDEVLLKNPQYQKYFSQTPKDPKTGTETESKYIYIVSNDGKACCIYANLENNNEAVTLQITSPTAGAGTGVLEAASPGWNGTSIYYQYSN